MGPPLRANQRVPKHTVAPRPEGRVREWPDGPGHGGEYRGRGKVGGQDVDFEQGADRSRQMAALQRHKVTLACLTLILASLIWKGAFLSHYFYRQDDFQVFDSALKTNLSWGYLTRVYGGHFFPGMYLIAWVLARAALYSWLAGSSVIWIMLAAASLAAWRMLRTLFGNRPAILIPLVLYLLSPLSFPADSYWITAVEAIPLQIAIFMALASHVHYVRTGNFRHALAAAAWLAFGLVFNEKAVVIAPLLFAVTAGFLTSRRLLSAVRATAVRLWRCWALYLALTGAFAATFVAMLHTSSNKPGLPRSLHAVDVFSSKLLLETLLPGLLGGPWRWFHTQASSVAYSRPLPDLRWVCLVIVLALVVASILSRPRAWRAWAILAGWIVLADMLPIVIGRLANPAYADILGRETRYVADTPAILAIPVGLAFWPLIGTQQDEVSDARRPQEFFGGRWKVVAVAMVAVFIAGSVWSVQRFQTLTSTTNGADDRAYVANARVALADAPAGTVIVNQKVPSTMMLGIFENKADTSVVLGPLSHRGSQIGWTSHPAGTIDQLRVFGADGRLWPAAVLGSTTAKTPFWRSCLTGKRSSVVLAFQPVSVGSAEVLRVGYVAAASAAGQLVTVRYGSFTGQFTVRPGLHRVYFAVRGSAQNVIMQAQPSFSGVCFAPAVAGVVGPFPGSPIPVTGAQP
jgi:hypothetical protein